MSALGLVAILLLFVVMSLIATRYSSEIYSIADSSGVIGMIVYVLITTVAVVVAPISTVPLIPVAASAWGWFTAGVLSVIGWVIGAQIAFYIARHFGKPLVQRFVPLDKLDMLMASFPKKNLFWAVVFFRMVVPVDVLSYAVGLFTRMDYRSYFFATLVGVSPFAFVLAYAGTLPMGFQVAAFLAGVVVILIGYVVYRQQIKQNTP